MEKRPQRPQGQKELGRQQNYGKTPQKANAPGPKLPRRNHNAQGRAAVGDQIHHNDRVQLHAQHLHGDPAEMFGLFVHLLLLLLVRLVYFQGGEPLQILQKAVAQGGVLPPITAQQPLGKLLHRHNGNRNQRHADHQHHRRFDAYHAQRQKQGHRGQHAVKKLRQIRPKIGFQLFHALGRKLHRLGGRHLLRISRAQPQQLFVNHFPQRLFYRAGGQKASPGRTACARKAHRRRGQQHRCSGAGQCGACAAKQQFFQQVPHSKHYNDVCRQGAPLQRHVPPNVFFCIADRFHQPLVDHHCFVFPPFLCSVSAAC